MRIREDNANARRTLSLSFCLSSPPPFLLSHRLSLLSSFSFSLLFALTCWCGLEPRLEVNSRVHLRSTRWIIQRTLTVPRKKLRADAACKSFQRDEASSVCVPRRFPQSASFPDTADFVGSCLRMIAGIPFANSNRKRLGGGRQKWGRETLMTLIWLAKSWISLVTCRKKHGEYFHLKNMKLGIFCSVTKIYNNSKLLLWIKKFNIQM